MEVSQSLFYRDEVQFIVPRFWSHFIQHFSDNSERKTQCQPGNSCYIQIAKDALRFLLTTGVIVTLPRQSSAFKQWIYPQSAHFWLYLNTSGLWFGFGLIIISKDDWQQVGLTYICNLYKLSMISYIQFSLLLSQNKDISE